MLSADVMIDTVYGRGKDYAIDQKLPDSNRCFVQFRNATPKGIDPFETSPKGEG
jgi:hypothetical protein